VEMTLSAAMTGACYFVGLKSFIAART